MEKFAPIVIFAYNRVDHLKKLIETLLQNDESKYSDLFVYSDAAANVEKQDAVNEVRKYLQSIKGFKRKTIIEREKNWGLRRNIIDGVTTVVEKYGRVIVLEDDLVLSPFFLDYMNKALDKYCDDSRVMQICGSMIDICTNDLPDSFFSGFSDCYGWATWKESWALYKRDPQALFKDTPRNEVYRYNKAGFDLWKQIIANYDGTLDSWAAYWYVTIVQNNGLVLYSKKPLSMTIYDESGTNCQDAMLDALNGNMTLLDTPVEYYPEDFAINEIAEKRMIKLYESVYQRNSIFRDTIRNAKNTLEGRKIAIWGMGHYGKSVYMELCKAENLSIDVECYDGGKLKSYYNDPETLKSKRESTFIIVALKNADDVKKIVESYGYKRNIDYCVVGE